MKALSRYLAGIAGSALVAACGGGGGSGGTDPDVATRVAAAQQTAGNNAYCTAIGSFYHELGDKNGAILTGSIGGTYTATTPMLIASASKWLFGAYVAEVRAGELAESDKRATHMLSGYVSMADSCPGIGATVDSCFHSNGNDTFTATEVDRFYYNGGHFQKWGSDNGMGNMTAGDLAAAYQDKLGITTAFSGPLLAGGAYTSAQNYAAFLRKILNGQLHIAGLLGSDAACTQPRSCPTADFSPITAEVMHYSVGHWVEDDPAVGDGAYNSAGAFGFYPWIDKTRTYYGIVARFDASGDGQGYASALCGRAIRKAYVTGTAQ